MGGEVVVCDSKGALHRGRKNLGMVKEAILEYSNPSDKAGSLKEILAGADVFIGVSRGGLLNADDIRTMAPNPIVALAPRPAWGAAGGALAGERRAVERGEGTAAAPTPRPGPPPRTRQGAIRAAGRQAPRPRLALLGIGGVGSKYERLFLNYHQPEPDIGHTHIRRCSVSAKNQGFILIEFVAATPCDLGFS